MASKLYDLARMTTATTGTGTITLGSAVSGYLTFAGAGAADGDIVSYGIKDGANSEVGTGTYTASGTTLSRTVTKSTNSNAAINLSGGAEVYITLRGEDLVPISRLVGTGTGLSGGGDLSADRTHSVSLTTASNILGADVALSNTANYFDGPSMAQGTSGTWFASGTVTIAPASNPTDNEVKLWDGATVIASTHVTTGTSFFATQVHLAGILASPAGNIRISVKCTTNATGKIAFNQSGNSKDSSIFGFRIA
jgi:hypothetical protein